MTEQAYDPIAYAYLSADHFSTLAVAIAWDQAATALVPHDPGAARIALERAIAAYKAYRVAWNKHLPASRFDDDYGRDLTEATQRRDALPKVEPATTLPPWMLAALDRRYAEAVSKLRERPQHAHELAVVAVLAKLCAIAGESVDAERLARWGA